MSSDQNLAGNNSSELSSLTSRELGDLIIYGQPGSQRSQDAISELIKRNQAIKSEIKDRWGIIPVQGGEAVPQPSNIPNHGRVQDTLARARFNEKISVNLTYSVIILLFFVYVVSLVTNLSDSISISISISIVIMAISIFIYTDALPIKRAEVAVKLMLTLLAGIGLGIFGSFVGFLVSQYLSQ